MVTTVRNRLYNKNIIESISFETSTIVVGNLSVGGTGKTPQIEYLIELLKDQYKVAVLSRGYKRKSKGFLLAGANSDARLLGDEPYQFYRKFPGINVAVSENRAAGIRHLEKLKDRPDVILLDDAFQHRKVQGGYSMLLTAYQDLYVDDYVLPTGNLRENSSGAKRAQIIIVTKCPETISEEERSIISKKLKLQNSQSLFFTSVQYGSNLIGSSNLALEKLTNTKILLVTGIANPYPLITYLKSKQIQIEHLKFPDHYDFKGSDIFKIKARSEGLNSVILTTEKDYVRLFSRLENVFYIPIKVVFIDQKNKFELLIKNYVDKNKKTSKNLKGEKNIY